MSRKNGTFGEIIVGLFMIAVIALMGYFTIVISGVDIIRGDNKVNVKIVFAEVGGLKDHDNVMYRGTKVGKVESVEVSPTNLTVIASVNKNIVMREGYEISVCNLSMIGGNYLLLEEGEGEALDLEETLFVGQTPVDWMRDVTKIASNLRQVTELKEIKIVASNIVSVTEKANSFMDKANNVADGADTFVGKLNVAADDIQITVDEARAFLASAKKAADGIESTVTNAKEFLAHATVTADAITSTSEDISKTAADFSTTAKGIMIAAEDFDNAMLKADSILGAVDGSKDKLIADLEAGIAAFRASAESFDGTKLMATANELATNLNELSLRLKNGEGTLGKLMTDSSMYDDVQGMIRDARQVLDNYRDTTPITTFSSLATGAL